MGPADATITETAGPPSPLRRPRWVCSYYNHNAWRSAHEGRYDVVAQMDPDHVPYPNFLERTLGYFADPDTAFVVAPQVYANLAESFVARGAAEPAYLFHGVIQRGGNGRGAPLLIGTNHLYQPRSSRSTATRTRSSRITSP
jgi:hypothetical protein